MSWGFPELRLGAGLLPQSPKRGLLQLGVGGVCVSMRDPGGLAEMSKGLTGVRGEPVGRAGVPRLAGQLHAPSQVALQGWQGPAATVTPPVPSGQLGGSSDTAAPTPPLQGEALRQPQSHLASLSLAYPTPLPAFQVAQLCWADTVPSQPPPLSPEALTWGLDLRVILRGARLPPQRLAGCGRGTRSIRTIACAGRWV